MATLLSQDKGVGVGVGQIYVSSVKFHGILGIPRIPESQRIFTDPKKSPPPPSFYN